MKDIQIQKNAAELEHFFPHGLNLLRFLFLDSHERVACCPWCTHFSLIWYIRFHFDLYFSAYFFVVVVIFASFCDSHSFLSSACLSVGHDVSVRLRAPHCSDHIRIVSLFLSSIESFVTVFNVANACHIRISPISLFALAGVCRSCFTVSIAVLTYHAHTYVYVMFVWMCKTPTPHHYLTLHNTFNAKPIQYWLRGTNDIKCAHGEHSAAWAACKIAIITQYAIKYLCLIRTSHSRITSSVFTLNARLVSILSLYYYILCDGAVCLCTQCTHLLPMMMVVIIITSWCAASFLLSLWIENA